MYLEVVYLTWQYSHKYFCLVVMSQISIAEQYEEEQIMSMIVILQKQKYILVTWLI